MAHQMSKNETIYWRKFENDDMYKKEIGIDTLQSWEPYGASKLANLLHMRHAAKLDPKVSFFSLHPGMILIVFEHALTFNAFCKCWPWAVRS